MTDCGRTVQLADDRHGVEMVADKAEAALGMKLIAVEGYDAGRFLAAVLEGVQAESCKRCGIGVVEDAENSAFLVKPVAAKVQGTPGCWKSHATHSVQS
jgi:hypothetical protein